MQSKMRRQDDSATTRGNVKTSATSKPDRLKGDRYEGNGRYNVKGDNTEIGVPRNGQPSGDARRKLHGGPGSKTQNENGEGGEGEEAAFGVEGFPGIVERRVFVAEAEDGEDEAQGEPCVGCVNAQADYD